MKKNVFIIFILLLTSCTINKPILVYTNDEIKNKNPDIVYVFKNKIASNYVINNLSKLNSDTTFTRSKFYTYNDFKNFKTKYKNDTLIEFWNNKDFKNIKCKFISNSLTDFKNLLSKKNLKIKTLFLSFSKPLYIENDTKILFYVSKSSSFGSVEFSKIIIMEKINKKWILIDEMETKELH